jgi:hypothetical protein
MVEEFRFAPSVGVNGQSFTFNHSPFSKLGNSREKNTSDSMRGTVDTD